MSDYIDLLHTDTAILERYCAEKKWPMLTSDKKHLRDFFKTRIKEKIKKYPCLYIASIEKFTSRQTELTFNMLKDHDGVTPEWWRYFITRAIVYQYWAIGDSVHHPIIPFQKISQMIHHRALIPELSYKESVFASYLHTITLSTRYKPSFSHEDIQDVVAQNDDILKLTCHFLGLDSIMADICNTEIRALTWNPEVSGVLEKLYNHNTFVPLELQL